MSRVTRKKKTIPSNGSSLLVNKSINQKEIRKKNSLTDAKSKKKKENLSRIDGQFISTNL